MGIVWILLRSRLVLQVFVYGDSLQSHLVAIVVPDPEELVPWANNRGIKKELSQLCRDTTVIDGVLSSMHGEGRLAKLRGFEQVLCLFLKLRMVLASHVVWFRRSDQHLH